MTDLLVDIEGVQSLVWKTEISSRPSYRAHDLAAREPEYLHGTHCIVNIWFCIIGFWDQIVVHLPLRSWWLDIYVRYH